MSTIVFYWFIDIKVINGYYHSMVKQNIFKYLKLGNVPKQWKTSCLVPCESKRIQSILTTTELKYLHLIKALERLVRIVPFRIVTFYFHLENTGSTVRIIKVIKVFAHVSYCSVSHHYDHTSDEQAENCTLDWITDY